MLKYIVQARERGLGVIFITHNPHHAYPVGDRFVVLNRGKLLGNWARKEISATSSSRRWPAVPSSTSSRTSSSGRWATTRWPRDGAWSHGGKASAAQIRHHGCGRVTSATAQAITGGAPARAAGSASA